MKKLKIFLSLLLCLAVNHIWAAPVVSPSDIQEGKIYTISTSTRGSIIWNGTADKLESTRFSSAILDSSNPNHQFTFIKEESSTDRFYMVNIGADKFVYQSSNRAALAEMSLAFWTIKTSGNSNYPLMIDAASGNHWNVDNNGYVFIDTWSTKDDGNCFKFEVVGDADEAYISELKERQLSVCKKITYTSTDEKVISPKTSSFGTAKIIANTYADGQGVIEFDKVVTEIGDGAFQNCTNLSSITIPSSVKNIGNNVFSGCSALPVINNIRYADTYLVEVVDKSCTSYSFKEGIKWIGYSAFQDCNNLVGVVLPNSVQEIQSDAFSNCSKLKVLVLSSELKSVNDYAFSGCSSLTSVTIPDLVTSIGNNAFHNCSSLTSISIPNSVTNIGSSAFEGCLYLTTVNLPSSLTSIENRTFCYCYRLPSISIPNSVTSIGEQVFCKCESLTSLDIPNSVKSIGTAAFYDCCNLVSINIPNSVKSMGHDVFAFCEKLTYLPIPNSITTIRSGDYAYCIGLTSVTIPDWITSIGGYAFENCTNLTSLTIPNSVTSIENGAFAVCSKLSSITNLATKPQTITTNCFSYYTPTLHVYSGLKSLYEANEVWRKFNIVDDVPIVKATSIELSSSIYYCNLYGEFTPLATVNPEATIKEVIWTSSDESILTILDENTGQAFGMQEGTVTITAKTIDGSNLSSSATVHIVANYVPVSSISLNKDCGSLAEDETLLLSATVLPVNATQKNVKWISSNVEIASVDQSGLVKAKKEGTVIISAISMDGTNVKANCTISVMPANVSITNIEDITTYTYLNSGDDFNVPDHIKKLMIKETISNINLTYTRNFSDDMVGNWQAWYMPCDFDYYDLSGAFDVAEVAGVLFDKDGQNYVAFRKMTEGTVKAHTPYVVRAKEAGDVAITATTTLQPTDVTKTHTIQSSYNNFTFGGVYENSYLSAEQPTYALNKSSNFALMSESVYLRPFRIYMRITDREDNPYAAVTAPQEVKVVVLGEDETSIDEIHNSQFIIHIDESSEIYNLAGQRVVKLQKGINIVNGRKVLF